jgi:3-dehydroquinate synthetase
VATASAYAQCVEGPVHGVGRHVAHELHAARTVEHERVALALPMARRVARCVAIKAAVVAEDETESGRRAILNYGHTLAHALERTTGHALAHGETVAIGLVFAAEVAGAMGRIDAARVRRHYEVVRDAYGLPVEVPRARATRSCSTVRAAWSSCATCRPTPWTGPSTHWA